MKDEHAKFSGSIPAAYDRYLGPILFQPYAEDLAARLAVKKTSSVLELACGTGVLTRVLRTYLPSKVNGDCEAGPFTTSHNHQRGDRCHYTSIWKTKYPCTYAGDCDPGPRLRNFKPVA
jgi:hypothetical protein